MPAKLYPPAAEFRQIAREFEVLGHHLETGRVGFQALVAAERELWGVVQSALTRLACDATKAEAFEQLWVHVEQVKRTPCSKIVGRDSCRRLVALLCSDAPDLEAEVWRMLSLALELGRTLWALKLVDRALRIKGSRFVGTLLERVKSNVLAEARLGQPDPRRDRTLQLASRLALERITSSSTCPPALRSAASVLRDLAASNLERIDVGGQGRKVLH